MGILENRDYLQLGATVNIPVGFYLAVLVFVASLHFGYVTRGQPRNSSMSPHWQFVAGLSAVLAISEIAGDWWENALLVVASIACICYVAFRLRQRWTAR